MTFYRISLIFWLALPRTLSGEPEITEMRKQPLPFTPSKRPVYGHSEPNGEGFSLFTNLKGMALMYLW